MSKLSNSILDAIRAKKITPTSKWYFIGMHTLLWGCFGLTLCIGIIGVSLLFLEMGMPERHYMNWMPLPGSMRLLPYLPFLWGFGSIICILIAYFVFHKTEGGYRISTVWIVGILILGSFSGGYALHRTKINTFGEKQIQRFVPPYARMRADFQKGIPLPGSGILPGKIESISDDGYVIESPDEKTWKVSLHCNNELCKESQKNLKKNQPILFIGKIKKDGDNELFEATDLDTPPPRRCRNNNKGTSCGRAFMSRSEKNKEGKKD